MYIYGHGWTLIRNLKLERKDCSVPKNSLDDNNLW